MGVVVARALSRSVLADQVKERILEGILSGHYPPDSRIVETQVARELGTSQAPVREALRGLEEGALADAGQQPWVSCSSSRSGERASAGRLVAKSSRPTPFVRPWKRWPPDWRCHG